MMGNGIPFLRLKVNEDSDEQFHCELWQRKVSDVLSFSLFLNDRALPRLPNHCGTHLHMGNGRSSRTGLTNGSVTPR